MRTQAPPTKRDRQVVIREIVAREAVENQQELADRLAARGYSVTQATVSRDVADLGLARMWRVDRHVYVLSDDLPRSPADTDERLRRILSDMPVTVAKSGLILVLTGSPGTANVIGQAIDEAAFGDQVGTVAGDNTLLVLFADNSALERWLIRFNELQSPPAVGSAPGTEETR